MYSFREGRPDDARTIAAYHYRCWVEAFAPLMAPGVVAAMDPWAKLDRWNQWLEPGLDFDTVVADYEGKPVGHTTVSGDELVHLFIDPDHWRRGVGERLLEIGERKLAEAGNARIRLTTIIGNDPAIALYESKGWQVTDEIVHNDHGNGVVFDEHVLVKHLA